MYTVMEGDGEVETCLALNSIANIDVLVIISTKQDGDANGKWSLGEVIIITCPKA